MSSIPQGDALSPWALNLVLTTAVKQIQEQWPQSVQVVFIDDRSYGSPNLTELLQVWDGWLLHSRQLGFVESLRKTQFFCKGRSELAEQVRTGPYLKDSLVALGVSFSVSGSAPSSKELSRFDKAMGTADRVRALPFNCSGKQKFANQVITGKASYGWILRAPPVTWCKKLLSCTRKAGYAHQRASVYLCKLYRWTSRGSRIYGRSKCCFGIVQAYPSSSKSTSRLDFGRWSDPTGQDFFEEIRLGCSSPFPVAPCCSQYGY